MLPPLLLHTLTDSSGESCRIHRTAMHAVGYTDIQFHYALSPRGSHRVILNAFSRLVFSSSASKGTFLLKAMAQFASAHTSVFH